MTRHQVWFILLVGLLLPAASAGAGAPTVGVLGDSYSDEYQFYQPDRSTSRNWVEMLATTRGLDFGSFGTASKGEPRREGYAYNWARSDATTEDLLVTGQHTGLAAQVASGSVSYVVIFIGGNDFIHALESRDPALELQGVLPRALANFRLALETILQASAEVKAVVLTVPDIRDLPTFQEALRTGRLTVDVLDAYSAALRVYNAEIRNLARAHDRVAIADFDVMARVNNRINKHYAYIAGQRLERGRGMNDLGHLFLADQRHMGTIGQGLMAQLIVNAMNARFAAGITPLSDRDIVGYASAVAKLNERRQGLATLGAGASNPVGERDPAAR